MKLLITLEKAEQRQAIGRIMRACKEHHVQIEAPIWNDNQSCELEIRAKQLSEDLQAELEDAVSDDSVIEAFLAA